VATDPTKPGIEAACGILFIEACDFLEGPREGFLHEVFGHRMVMKDRTSDPVDALVIAIKERSEVLPIPRSFESSHHISVFPIFRIVRHI
jgi:hypothetical protein